VMRDAAERSPVTVWFAPSKMHSRYAHLGHDNVRRRWRVSGRYAENGAILLSHNRFHADSRSKLSHVLCRRRCTNG